MSLISDNHDRIRLLEKLKEELTRELGIGKSHDKDRPQFYVNAVGYRFFDSGGSGLVVIINPEMPREMEIRLPRI